MALAVEVKAHDGELSQHQEDFLNDVMRRGGLAMTYGPTKDKGAEEFYLWPQETPIQWLKGNTKNNFTRNGERK